jgi:hypothetical protein
MQSFAFKNVRTVTTEDAATLIEEKSITSKLSYGSLNLTVFHEHGVETVLIESAGGECLLVG